MSEQAVSQTRTGQSNAFEGTERTHMLVALVNARHGALDRVVNVLRRRRANLRTLVVTQSEVAYVVRVTAIVNDAEVHVDQLAEQLRKIVDVRHIVNISAAQAVARELALVKVNCTALNRSEIIEIAHLSGAHAVDITPSTITLEVTGSEEKVGKLIDQLQGFGIREMVRTGSVAITRDSFE